MNLSILFAAKEFLLLNFEQKKKEICIIQYNIASLSYDLSGLTEKTQK